MTEKEAYIALNMMDKIGPVGVRSLMSVLGSATAIFEVSGSDLRQARGIGKDVAEAILSQRENVAWQEEMLRAASMGVCILTQIDPEYPAALHEIHDPPLTLYARGRFKARDAQAIGVVGSRRPTHYGREWAEKLSYQLAKAGFTVVSGLALGIDTAAHEGALKAHGRTVAVMGSGLDQMYPADNRKLAEHISENGVVVSEFPLGRKPDKTTFPMRNRIVSGMVRGVLVVEAGRKSGALITAHQALEQGRDVFAVPGRIDSSLSCGTHDLIKSGAKLVTSAEDVLEEYDSLLRMDMTATEDSRPMPILNEEESAVMTHLQEGELQVDSLIRLSGMGASRISALLIGLEMKKLIRMLPGRMVEAR